MVLKLPGLFGFSELFNRQPGDGEIEARFGNRKDYYDEELGQPEVYDEFLGSALKTQRWTETTTDTGDVSVGSSLCVLSTGTTDTSVAQIKSVKTVNPTSQVSLLKMKARVKFNFTAADEGQGIIGLKSTNNTMTIAHFTTSTLNTAKAQTSDESDSTLSDEFEFLEGEYNIIEIVYRVGDRVEYWVNGILIASHVTPLPEVSEDIGMFAQVYTGAADRDQSVVVDWSELYIR